MFKFRERAKQLIDFSSMQDSCGILPTDVDAEIDYYNKAWVFIEFKHRDAPLSVGQKIAFERKVDDMDRAKKPAVYVVAEHYVDNPDNDVDAARCIVREFYYRGKWYRPKCSCTLGEMVNRFLERVGTSYVK